MENIPPELAELAKEAERRLSSDSAAEQVIALRTSGSHFRHLLNHSVLAGGTAEEDAFVSELAEKRDTEIQYLVCLWRDGALDVPSRHLRLRLEALSPMNGDAKLLLRGGSGFTVKKLKSLR